MLLHVRRILVVGPDEPAVVLFSDSSSWARIMSELLRSSRRGTVRRHGMVIVSEAPDETLESLEGREDISLCQSCLQLRPCHAYEVHCESAARDGMLLTGADRAGTWEWIAPESVLIEARLSHDSHQRTRELKRKLGAHETMPNGATVRSFRDVLLDAIERERTHLKRFGKGFRQRLRETVAENAGRVVANAADELIDQAFDQGAQKLREAVSAFRSRRESGASSGASGSPVSAEARAIAEAEILLGLRWPYTMEELNEARKRATITHHPDRPGGSESKMKEVNVAYDRLRETLK